MKTILIPTDFSEQSINAIDAGFQLAEISGAEMILLNVIEIGKGYFDASGEQIEPGEDEHDFIIQAKKRIKIKLDELCTQHEGVSASTAVKIGNTYANITKMIEDHQVDLVIMGSKGASGIKELLIGSNTEKIVRYTKAPVLTIKDRVDLSAIENIVLAIDPRDKFGDALSGIKEFQSILNAKLHVLKINTLGLWRESKEINKELKAFAEDNNLTNYTLNIYDAQTPEDGILSFSAELDADIISLFSHSQLGLGRIINGSLAEDMVNHAKRPILTFNLSD